MTLISGMLMFSFDRDGRIVLACLGLAAVFAAYVVRYWYRARRLPPGPPRSFFFGNEKQLPWQEPWKVFAQWSKTYGPLIYLYAFGRDVIIVNDAKVASDFLENHALLYTRRPTWSMARLTGRQDNIAFMDYTERQRKGRSLLQAALGPRTQKDWGPVLEDESVKMMHNMIRSPETYKQNLKRFLASFITRFTYGIEADDSYVAKADELSVHTLQALRPGRWLADIIPPIVYLPEWLPGMGFKRWARMAKTKFEEFTRVPYKNAREAVLNGTATSSMVTNNLQDIFDGKSKIGEDSVISAASSIYTASTDTSGAMLSSFLLLMTVHRDIQDKAHDEIMRVVGGSRLPMLKDQSSLPYVNSIMKEIHRWNPVTPMLPRSPVQDHIYNGQLIPENTWGMFNIWAMTHDESTYTRTDAFDPDRFMPTDGKEPERDPRDFTFGWGKRICPGLNLANAQVFLFMSQILSVFQILPPLDADGKECVPPLEYMSLFVSVPKPFTCRLVPRDNDIAHELAASAAEL